MVTAETTQQTAMVAAEAAVVAAMDEQGTVSSHRCTCGSNRQRRALEASCCTLREEPGAVDKHQVRA